MQKMIIAATVLLVAAGSWMAFASNKSKPVSFTGTGSISGYVTDAQTGSGIPDAVVVLNANHYFTTDSTGLFLIDKLEADTYALEISATGYATSSMDVSIADNEQKVIYIPLELPVVSIADSIGKMQMQKPEKKYRTKDAQANAPMLLYDQVAEADISYYMVEKEGQVFEDNGNNTEAYNKINETGFRETIKEPLSTFSIDVDNASYSNIRRMIEYGYSIPEDAVRIEEMVNYFDFTYAQPKGSDPFSINFEMSACPWNKETQLVLIGLQGKEVDMREVDPSNLVFLIDVSGSMGESTKLPLVKESLKTLVNNLNPNDRIALVVYAGAAGEVLPSTPCSNKQAIFSALDKLESGGSTAGGAGIQLAYNIASKNYIEGGNNRVILCTDGDFNVGASSDGEMTRLIEEKRKSGVFITVCGFGMGNLKDSKMESIADNGNGAYYYIDSQKEASKVFGTDLRGTLFTIAKDVKLQVEFNPAYISSYRLIGYDNRVLANEDFDNDAKDAGDLGAGHKVTALYEITLSKTTKQPTGTESTSDQTDYKYQTHTVDKNAYNSGELMTLKMRYKEPDGTTSKLLEKVLYNQPVAFAATSDNFRFACAVTEFGMLLRASEFAGNSSISNVITLATGAQGADTFGYRKDFIKLVKQYESTLAQK